jgi:3-oxoadipate enol-lactonase
MPRAAVNGIEISYADSGAGAGGDAPAVLLSHGYLMDHSMFEHQVAALAPEFRVITWDERGFGDTPAPGPFSYWDSAADAAIPMARARELAGGLGGPTGLVEIDGGPHAANLTHPAQVHAAILPFLRGLAGD